MVSSSNPVTRLIVAKNVRALRQGLALSQEELAERSGLTQVSVSCIERGVTSTTLDVLDRLAAALNVKPADLVMSKGTR